MIFKHQLTISFAAVCLFMFLPMLEFARVDGQGSQVDQPDFTQGDTIPDGFTHDWNLGPTGTRGWIYSRRLETRNARQILVTKVEKGSPADGVLRVGDVILGVSEQLFKGDPRVRLGKAICKAESRENDGKLSLMRWRDGNTESVVLNIPVLGSYSKTAPWGLHQIGANFKARPCRFGSASSRSCVPCSSNHPFPQRFGPACRWRPEISCARRKRSGVGFEVYDQRIQILALWLCHDISG